MKRPNISPESKEAHIRVYARAHPEQSKSQVYEHFKGTKYGARKTDTLRWISEERKEKPVSQEKRARSVPKKYREKARIEEEPSTPMGRGRSKTTGKGAETGAGAPVGTVKVKSPSNKPTESLTVIKKRMESLPSSYSIAHVRSRGHLYHIKFDSENAYHRQLGDLVGRYQLTLKGIKVSFEGPYPYKGDYFVTPEFEREMKRRGVW